MALCHRAMCYQVDTWWHHQSSPPHTAQTANVQRPAGIARQQRLLPQPGLRRCADWYQVDAQRRG